MKLCKHGALHNTTNYTKKMPQPTRDSHSIEEAIAIKKM